MISLLLSLLVILLGGLSAPTPAPPSYPGTQPTVVVKPVTLRAGSPARVSILGMPAGATRVRLVADSRSWPTRVLKHHVFAVRVVPQTAGPWELDISFTLHGHHYTVLGTVATVHLS
jgi:hypothetical protein